MLFFKFSELHGPCTNHIWPFEIGHKEKVYTNYADNNHFHHEHHLELQILQTIIDKIIQMHFVIWKISIDFCLPWVFKLSQNILEDYIHAYKCVEYESLIYLKIHTERLRGKLVYRGFVAQRCEICKAAAMYFCITYKRELYTYIGGERLQSADY
jgi:hypothetical protein